MRILSKIWSLAKSAVNTVGKLCRRVFKPVFDVTDKAWSEAKKKLPILRYLDSFWVIFGVYMAIVLIMAVGLVISAAVQGLIGPLATLLLIAKVPMLLAVVFATQPLLLVAMLVETAFITVCINVMRALTTGLVEKAEKPKALRGRTEVIVEETGEVFGYTDGIRSAKLDPLGSV